MRKAQQEEILDFIKNLYQAHEEIKGAFNQKKTVTVQNMLSECQEFAQSLGETIERTEGEGHITVSYIEAYCETLFYIYEQIEGSQINENKICKILNRALLKIENSVKKDIHVRREIAFFPYMASMWDSLESIYLAAKEDKECDVYCVPIPYYELTPDHRFGQMHYEGEHYPGNIEITDWRTYNFEERRPDAVYIHNAYDDWNLVTSVHPRFYSKNLKQYARQVVYVPYFILGKINPDDRDAVEKMKHFCFLPGIINADKVIVESEDVKKIYVSEFIKAAKADRMTGKHLDRKYLEQKILGIGSPKFDRVASVSQEEVNIPAEWKKHCYKSDGNCKKIVLYNNSIAALLKNGDEMLRKMESILETFRANKEQITLWWRPHPLIQSTIQAMRPILWERYQRLVKGYMNEDWGIYDDTSDVERAVVLSDAYYGDWSSVVQLYRQTGKPIMIVDCAK